MAASPGRWHPLATFQVDGKHGTPHVERDCDNDVDRGCSCLRPGPFALFAHHDQNGALNIVPPGPGFGWGFPNGAIDGYGWVDYGYLLPLGGR